MSHAEFDAIRRPRQRAVVAKKLGVELIAVKLVPALHANLLRPQTEPFLSMAKLRAKLLQFGLRKTERDRKRDVDRHTEKLNGQDVH